MGVSLEEALNHLYRRMPSASLQQIITAVLLARETGGNLPVIFNRIVNTIRERRKIEENIKTLTLQGRIQGVVMSILPVAFGFVLYSTNPRYIDNMLTYDIGRKLLVAAVILETFGVFFIWRISRLTEY
jgi:tight adherence protein B